MEVSAVVLWCAFSLMILISVVRGESSTQQFVSYNSSDLSYLSNGIQFPAPDTMDDPLIEETYLRESAPEMEWMGRLYNHHGWKGHLTRLSDPKCRGDMNAYLAALNNGTSWAAKMHDASGRYTTQFFFGNDYWLGSSALCKELGNEGSNLEVPPFAVGFYVAKVRINVNEILTPVTRQLNLGQCLPKSCKVGDVRLLLIQEKSQATSLNVIDVRPVPGDYSVFADTKFYIIGVCKYTYHHPSLIGSVALIIYGLIAIASLVSYFRKESNSDKHAPSQNNNNNNNNNVESGKPFVGSQETKQRSGKVMQLLLCFCFTSNAEKILTVDKLGEDAIKCVHGLRFFSIAWIIMVHTYLEVFAIADNKTYRTLTERSFLYQTVSNATFSVDTFFFISGLLVTILFYRAAEKKATQSEDKPPSSKLAPAVRTNGLKFLTMLLYRFFRLTPAYLFVLGINELVLKISHNNSVFSPAIIDHLTCSAYWWRNALYINNFFPQSEFCMLWSWYISNDTQFYVIAVILLLIAVSGKTQFKWAVASLIAFLITSWITTFIIAMRYNYVARVEEPFALFNELYDKPWLRIGPYLVGMMTGYLLFRVKKFKLHSVFVVLGWVLSLGVLLSLVYGLGRKGLVVPLSAVYAAFGHTAWGLALAWITVACCWGYGGPVNALLSFRGFLPLSRLTYCAYLIHPVIMVYVSFTMDGPVPIENVLVMIIVLGNIVASFVTAFLISVAFETPIVHLLKILLMPPSSSSSSSSSSASASALSNSKDP